MLNMYFTNKQVQELRSQLIEIGEVCGNGNCIPLWPYLKASETAGNLSLECRQVQT